MALPQPSPPASIWHLAVELLEQIFTYACTDSGYTGRSLSLVSRGFREVVRPIRFQSVALSNYQSTEAFLACLEKERTLANIRVHHLFLSTWADGEEIIRVRDGHVPRWDGLHTHAPTAAVNGPHWCVWMTLQQAIDKKLGRLLPRLLKTLANDLRTLSIVHSWEFGAIQLPSTFPCLREFTYCGPPPSFPGYRTDVRRPPPCFPSLQRLHVVCWNTSTVCWIINSPFLTHLRLSDLGSSASSLANELQISLGGIRDSSSALAVRRPPLVHVRLQPRGVSGGYCAPGDVEHSLFVWRLKKLHPRPGVRLELMRDRHYHDGYWDGRIRRDWLDGISAGHGWWLGGEEREDGDEKQCSSSDDDDDEGTLERLVTHWMQQN